MSDVVDDVVPLPAHLSECGCPNAQAGMHVTTCIPAREHAAIPLSDRPEYELGRRFRAISWQYPLRVELRMSFDISVDPFEYIASHWEEYETFQPDEPYVEWEKPILFLVHEFEDECDGGGPFFRHSWIGRSWSNSGDYDTSPRWTQDAGAQLLQRLARAPEAPEEIPGQEQLDV